MTREKAEELVHKCNTKTATSTDMVTAGLMPYSLKNGTGILYLLHKNMYGEYLDGVNLTDIFGRGFVFDHKKTDNDYRAGYLAYGFLIKE